MAFRTQSKNIQPKAGLELTLVEKSIPKELDNSRYGSPTFDYENDLANDNLTLRLTPKPNAKRVLSYKEPIVGLIEQDFTFGVNNEYEAPMQEMGSSISKTLNMALSGVTGIAGGDNAVDDMQEALIGKGQGQILLNPRSSTFLMWTGHDRPTLNLTFNWIRLRRNEKPLTEQVMKVFNTASTNSARGFMSAPNGYSMAEGMKKELLRLAESADAKEGYKAQSIAVDLDVVADGTYTLELGRWFILKGLVVESAEVSFSAQTPVEDGSPDQVQITMTLKPIITLTQADIEQAFKVRRKPEVI